MKKSICGLLGVPRARRRRRCRRSSLIGRVHAGVVVFAVSIVAIVRVQVAFVFVLVLVIWQKKVNFSSPFVFSQLNV